jgi:Domain of unknown function (DUF1707)
MNMTQTRSTAAQMRASDADRDAVVAALSEHYQAGRLSTDELADRTGSALTARTYGDLSALTADLPGPVPAGPAPGAGGRPDGPPSRVQVHRGGLVMLAVLAAVLVVGGAFGLLAPGHHGADAWGLLPAVLIVARLTRSGDRSRPRRSRRL